MKRSKAKVLDKILSMGLVHEKRELYKKRSRGKKNNDNNSDIEDGLDNEKDDFIDDTDSDDDDKSKGIFRFKYLCQFNNNCFITFRLLYILVDKSHA